MKDGLNESVEGQLVEMLPIENSQEHDKKKTKALKTIMQEQHFLLMFKMVDTEVCCRLETAILSACLDKAPVLCQLIESI